MVDFGPFVEIQINRKPPYGEFNLLLRRLGGFLNRFGHGIYAALYESS
jgi:hypothetical protein